MKIICSKENLLKGINIVLKAIPSKTTMPILECILINAANGTIKFTANDTELGIETSIDGDIVVPGKIALEAKIFSEMIRKLPDDLVTIDSDENYNTLITCQKAKFNLSGKSGNDFTSLPLIEKQSYIGISQFNLRDIIRQTIFSISDSENNHMMSGELFEITENQLRVVSLDGHRISIRKLELKDHYENIKVIVPGKTLSEISKILSGGIDDEVLIFFTKNQIMFEFDETLVVSRLIEGNYFKIDQMLSADYETKISLNKQELISSIERAILLVKENDKKPLILNINDSSMELKLTSGIGSLNEDIEIEKTGKDLMIGFNPKLILDALRVIDDETITLYMVNPKAPCFIKDETESYIYLILPVNFNM